ncbi:MAG: tetratricopeptide repeat protein [Burkholderiales bacterium]|nr:tetratricopeptide repeat protein [Burkholderiales bacterium]
MKRSLRLAAVALAVAHAMTLPSAQAQTAARPAAAEPPTPPQSALDADLFYRLLLGEISARSGEANEAFALILDSARTTGDPRLYERAIALALQARDGDSALIAARAWRAADPQSRDANRYVLQILLALNRVADTVEPLRNELAAVPAPERPFAIASVPRYYARVSDRRLAARVVEQALVDELRVPATAPTAWTTVGRMRMAAGDLPGALEAARRGQAGDPSAEGPALLALEMLDPKVPEADALIQRYLSTDKPLPELRLGYARALIDLQRYAEATTQLQAATADKPDLAEAWLILGTLQAQDNKADAGEAALQRYLALAPQQVNADERRRGQAQAYLVLSQIAEKRGDLAGAETWLARIENAQDLIGLRARRASILARQGRLEEARALIRSLPARNAAEAKLRLSAEVQLLRDAKQYQAAYDLLADALSRTPDDTDLLYDQAMLAEKLDSLSEMERLLRRVLDLKPDAHHAYNALGYSLADRNVRLDEARAFINKALEFAPNDPFISDSLGWVEFRAGNRTEAARILERAYRARPDAEIAAHLGEVLWTLGQRERAMTIWREGLGLAADNETLQETLRRLRVRP